MSVLFLKALEQRIANSELGKEWIDDPMMNKDIWALTDLGYNQEECLINGTKNIHFNKFSLSWLKVLVKLTIKASARQKHSISQVCILVSCLRQLDSFLLDKGYSQPLHLTNNLLDEFIGGSNTNHRKTVIVHVSRLWAEEQWLNLSYIPPKFQKKKPKIETIPEEVLYQIYKQFDLFPSPLERLFRLQLVLGCRIGEMVRIPRQCLKQEGERWFLLRWVQKRKHWRFYQIHSKVAELVREQQRFLDIQFGCNSDFDKLFCKLSAANRDGADFGKRFEVEPVYLPEVLRKNTIYQWIQAFNEKADLKDKQGKRFNLKSHMLRRTKASIMAYCEAEDEYIAAILGHGSLDMLPHYRQRSLERLEREANAKGYVDMYGKVTDFKPRKRRYERLTELLKMSTPLGECHRPSMLGDCKYRYACLSCDHHRVTLADQHQLEEDLQNLQQDLKQAQNAAQERRVTEINRLLKLLQNRLEGLKELRKIKGDKGYEDK